MGHHALLCSAALAEPYRAPGSGDGLTWLLTYTPLHLVWAGTEAVIVFFVLSGFVLTLPFLGGARSGWASYYLKRLLRLYLPVWGAVLLAVVLALALARDGDVVGSWWLASHGQVTADGALRSISLVFGADFSLNSALWSLQWEVLFSLTLPAFLLLLARGRRLLGVRAVALAGCVAVGSWASVPALTYLPAFGVGVVLAADHERLSAVAGRLTGAAWAALGSAAVLLLLAYWLLLGVFADGLPQALLTVSLTARVAGAALVVFLFAHWRPAMAVADRPSCAWLGSRSFSIYLVHEPIVVALGYLARGEIVLVLLLAPVLSLLTAEVFFRLIERPSHQLSRRAGRRVARATAPRPPLTA